MNAVPKHIKIDKGYLDSLFKQGLINLGAYNMLNEGRTGYEEEEEDPWARLGLEKKSKGTKNRKVRIPVADDSVPPEPVVDDSVPQEPVDANKVPEAEPEPHEAWDVVPSPLSQPPEDGHEEVRSAEDVREEEEKNGEVKHVDAAGWVFTWCFRCKRVDVVKFGGKTLPEWFVTNLNYKGDKIEPVVLSICCMRCNNKHRQASVSIVDEEKRLRQAFETLRIDCNSIGEKALRVAEARIGREVSMVQWGGRAGSVDIEMMKKNLSPEDIAVSINMEAYGEGKEGADLELGGLAGGLF